MGIIIYGASDDIIEIEGIISEEYGCYAVAEKGVNIKCSDGTRARISYNGDWTIEVIEKGYSFKELIKSVGEDGTHIEKYSDCTSYSDLLILDDIDFVCIGRKTFKA